jgi:periplasmic protein TonB
MINNPGLSELRYERGNPAYVKMVSVSLFLHIMIVAGISFIISQFSAEKVKFPHIIELVSFPMPKSQPPSFMPPQRVAKLPANKPAPSLEAAVPEQPIPQISSASETAPAEFSVPTHEETSHSNAPSDNPANGPQGEKGNEIVEIGSLEILDNVEYSPLYNPKPAYPLMTIRAGIQGSVDVDLVINEFGRVEEFAIVRVEGHPDFGNETAKVIGKWRFPPPRINGKKVKIKYLYTVNFRLH